MKKCFECILVIFCYWLAIFIGPAIVLLWNNFSYYVSGLGYGPESLMYNVLTFFSQPVSCFLAAAIATSVGKEKHNLCVLTNCIIGSIFCVVLTLSYVNNADFGVKMWSMLVSTIACIITAVMMAKEVEETPLVHKIKNAFGCIFTTVIIWTIARFAPGFIGAIFPEIPSLQSIAFVAFLPVGWYTAKAFSKEKHLKCIRTNLYIFLIIEVAGIFETITYILQSLSLSTGRYSTDMYGIPYSEYWTIFGTALLLQIVYIALCVYLIRKTKTSNNNETEQPPIELQEKNCEEKQLAELESKD